MIISLIVAMAKNRTIGKNNKLPWKMPADVKYFKDKTIDKSIIMGRKTFESIGRPLPDRSNIIITNNQNYKAEGCIVVDSMQKAINASDQSKEIMIIGGASIYKMFLDIADKIYLTIVDKDFDGDTFFPEIDKTWIKTDSKKHNADEKNLYPYEFITLEKK